MMFQAFFLATLLCSCSAVEPALNAYQAACLRLQFLANWMSVLLKLKSAWASTTTSTINPRLQLTKGALPERPQEGECKRSLQVTLQMYIHYQAQLLRLKAALGGRALQTGKTQLKGTIENLDILNKTSLDILEKLIENSQFIISAENFMSTFRNISNIPNRFLKEQRSDRQFQESRDLNETRVLFKTVDFFQNLGTSMDKILRERLLMYT